MTLVFDEVVPALREQGVMDDEAFQTIFVENPRRWLTARRYRVVLSSRPRRQPLGDHDGAISSSGPSRRSPALLTAGLAG